MADEPLYCQRCGALTEPAVVDDRRRPRCPACGMVTYLDPKLAVAVVVSDRGRILLGRRAEGARNAGAWSFPAGFVERGEVVESAAVREVLEETGLQIRLTSLVGLYSSPGEAVVLAVFAGEVLAGEARAGDDLDAVGWFDPADLPPLAFPHDQRIVQTWRDGRRP